MAHQDSTKALLLEELAHQGITDPQVLQAIQDLPRELFVPDLYRDESYANKPLLIGFGQTISQPYVVALMTQELHLTPEDKVLEIGTGSGYQTALLAKLARTVYTIERIPELQKQAKSVLDSLHFTNIHYQVGDGSYGWIKAAPFDAILITAAGQLPLPLSEQLKLGGRLILPQDGDQQRLKRYTKTESGLKQEDLGSVNFVPLITTHG